MAAQRAPDNPYLAARQEWSERYGSYVRAASAWRAVGILSLAMAVIGFGYALYLSTQVKLVPYIVEVDKLGNTVSGGFPQQIEYADARVVRATLGISLQAFAPLHPMRWFKSNISTALTHCCGQVIPRRKGQCLVPRKLAFEKAVNATIAIEVNNIVALSNQTYQIDWTEYERDRKGKEVATRRFRGIATVAITSPQDEATIRLNPIGVYVTDFDWTAQL